jgi:hypothetical protein
MNPGLEKLLALLTFLAIGCTSAIASGLAPAMPAENKFVQNYGFNGAYAFLTH